MEGAPRSTKREIVLLHRKLRKHYTTKLASGSLAALPEELRDALTEGPGKTMTIFLNKLLTNIVDWEDFQAAEIGMTGKGSCDAEAARNIPRFLSSVCVSTRALWSCKTFSDASDYLHLMFLLTNSLSWSKLDTQGVDVEKFLREICKWIVNTLTSQKYRLNSERDDFLEALGNKLVTLKDRCSRGVSVWSVLGNAFGGQQAIQQTSQNSQNQQFAQPYAQTYAQPIAQSYNTSGGGKGSNAQNKATAASQKILALQNGTFVSRICKWALPLAEEQEKLRASGFIWPTDPAKYISLDGGSENWTLLPKFSLDNEVIPVATKSSVQCPWGTKCQKALTCKFSHEQSPVYSSAADYLAKNPAQIESFMKASLKQVQPKGRGKRNK